MGTYQDKIGERITRLRDKANLSGNELAKRAGLSQPYLWQIEAGEKDPPASTIKLIADALGVDPGELLPAK